MNLASLIPNPNTRQFIGDVYRCWGKEWAAVLTRALMEGVLIDMGGEGARTEEVKRPLPTQEYEQESLF